MSKYRNALPQLAGGLFLTDGGLETTLIYDRGLSLPAFASFDLLRTDEGAAELRRYYATYAQMANRYGLGFVLESPTWRANKDWGAKLGHDEESLRVLNTKAIELMDSVRVQFERPGMPMVISGNVGPRGDGYTAEKRMSALQAYMYHVPQVRTFSRTAADMVAAFTMNYVEEAQGIVMAAKVYAVPVAISFTLEIDGRLPSGQSLREAIEKIDEQTEGYTAYYMINCAHPSHFAHVFDGGTWQQRVRGIRANSSKRSHAELDACTDLDSGNPRELGRDYRALSEALPKLAVVGGCCGTDHRHVEEICRALAAEVAAAA